MKKSDFVFPENSYPVEVDFHNWLSGIVNKEIDRRRGGMCMLKKMELVKSWMCRYPDDRSFSTASRMTCGVRRWLEKMGVPYVTIREDQDYFVLWPTFEMWFKSRRNIYGDTEI